MHRFPGPPDAAGRTVDPNSAVFADHDAAIASVAKALKPFVVFASDAVDVLDRKAFNRALVQASQTDALHGQHHVVAFVDFLNTCEDNIADIHVLACSTEFYLPRCEGHGEQTLERSVDVHEPEIVSNLGNRSNDEVPRARHVCCVDGVNGNGGIQFSKPPELGGDERVVGSNNSASCSLPGGWPNGHSRGHQALLGAALTLGHSFLSNPGEPPTHDKGHPSDGRRGITVP